MTSADAWSRSVPPTFTCGFNVVDRAAAREALDQMAAELRTGFRAMPYRHRRQGRLRVTMPVRADRMMRYHALVEELGEQHLLVGERPPPGVAFSSR